MRKGKKLTFLATVLCTLALLMSLFSITPFAASATAEDTTNKVTATTTTTVKQGDTVNCYVYIDSLESLSSLNVAVHFDPDKVSVTSSFNSASCALYDSSINESYVQFSYIFDGNGEATKTQLFYFQYKVLTNAEEGAAHFDIVVSEAYDSSLNVANISGSRCPFTIAKKVTSKTCTVYGTSPVSTAIKEEFELSYRLNTTGVASGSFVIRYDAELFEFIECSVGGLLENKFYDIKTDQPGIIYVSFVGTEYSSNAQLLTVKFKTIRNATQSSQIKLSVTDFYDLELNSIGCNGYTTNVNLTYDPTYSDDAPTMTVSTVYSAQKQQVTVTIKLDAGSYLGAGDFVLNFNTEYFTYNSATKGFVPTFFNINDKKASEGIIKFSIISLEDIMTEETVLTVILDTPVFCNDVIADFDIGGSGLSDSMTNPILINFVDSSLSISGVGHDLISHPAQAPTCTEIGWYAYATCSRCDYTTYEEIPANGHSYVHTICTFCDDKQPVFRSWDVSAAGDGSVMANLYENVVDGGYELEIAGTGVMMDWTSTSNVPWYNAYRSQINYLIIEDGITSIGARAFYGCTALTDAVIPNNVETIGYSAFYGCSNLSSVTFGNSVKTVGNYAFYGCISLASVALPNSVETIEGYAFYNCTSISNLSLGTSVTTIETYAFGNCSALTNITIPESVTAIGSSAFVNCYLLNEINFNASAMNDLENNNNVFFNAGINGEGIAVTIGANVTKIPAYLFYSTSNGTSYLPKVMSVTFADGSVCESIGSYAFYYVDEITSIVLPNTLKSIGNYAFAYCYALTSADLGNSVETIGSNAFYNCTALEGVDLGNAVVSIGSSAFYNCYALESITIPETVTTISTYAFYNSKALTEIIFNATAMADLSNNNYVFYNAGVDGDGVTVRIGAKVTKIPAYLFYATSNNTSYNPKITSVTFEDNSACKTIGTFAFAYGKNFGQIILPEGVETIGDYAFYYCSNLLRVQIPSSVTSIGYYAFINCPNIVFAFGSEALPASLSSSWRNSDTIYHLNAERFVVVNEAMYIIFNDETAAIAKYYGSESEYTILDKVDNVPVVLVGKNAFRSNTALRKIVIPDTVTKIDEYAFYYADELTRINLPASIETIGTYAFANCYVLSSITIPESVTTIGSYAFYNCKALTEIIFNATAMADLANNNYVFYNAGVDGDGISVLIGKNVTRIPSYLFYSTSNNTSYLPKITSVIFEDSSVCQSIGTYAFYYSKNLVEVSLPEGMETIERSAFYYCSNLLRVMIPDTVTQIDTYAFYGCTKAIIGFESDALPTTLGSSWYSSEAAYYLNVKQFAIVEDALYVIFNDDTAVFAKYYGSATEYQILETVEGISVTAIGSNAFRNNTTIESVTIPDTVTQINAYAFYGCSALKSITIPKNITAIGKSAFYNCTNVEEIAFNAISMNDLAYENYVFYNNGKNTEGISVTIGEEVTKIPAYLFRSAHDDSYNPKITSIVFAENSICESIGSCSFYGLDHLKTIIIPESVTSIASHAMSYCAKLTIGFESVELPEELGSYWEADSGYYLNVKELVVYDDATYVITNDGKAILGRYFGTATQYEILEEVNGIPVTQIGANALYRAEFLEKVTVPSSITFIGAYAFAHCYNLKEISLPSNIVSIGIEAFYYCENLTSLLIPEAVVNIGSNAFTYCNKLTIGFVSEAQNATLGSSWNGDSGYYYNAREFVVHDDSTYVITNDNTAILGRYYGTASEYNIFERVNGASVTIIGKSAFRKASSLVNVSIPDTVTRIENNAFYYCTALESITIPENVVHIGNYAFYYTRALTEINFDAIAVNDLSSSNYVFYCSGQSGDGIKVTIGAQVTKISNYLFCPYSNTNSAPKIKEIVFEEESHCRSIGDRVFYYNPYIEQVELPDSLETVGECAFAYCSALFEVSLGESLNFIDEHAFRNTIIESISIPDGVTVIERCAFYGCTMLYEVKMSAALERIGYSAFNGCSVLSSILIPENVTYIESYAFNNCISLTEIIIPASVTTIGNHAFYGTSFNLVYICSDKIAYNANSSSACGYLIDGVSSVVIRADIERVSSYIKQNYAKTETITYEDIDYIIYSSHEHTWSEYQELIPYIACKQDGCTRYICSDCGAFKDVIIDCHDEIVNNAKSPNCTEIGWHEYVTCSRCNYTTYEEIPATGHKVEVDNRYSVNSFIVDNSYVMDNDSNRGMFEYVDGTYISMNKDDSSQSNCIFTATEDTYFDLYYRVSSEQNYDFFNVYKNGEIIISVSGEIDWTYEYVYLYCGDVLEFVYVKDASGYSGDDAAYFYFSDYSGVQDERAYTFELIDGYYTSNNKQDGTSSALTLRFLEDCCFSIQYDISSEQVYDKFRIIVNSEVVLEESGNYYGSYWDRYFCAGDLVTFIYEKDSGGSYGEDLARFTINSSGAYEELGATRQFEKYDNTYRISNVAQGQSVILAFQAIYDCNFSFSATLSCQRGMDSLIAYRGYYDYAWSEWTGSYTSYGFGSGLSQGDLLLIVYTKNEPASSDSFVEFTFECEETVLGQIDYYPTDDYMPTCTNGVICDVCNLVAQEALGHDTVDHEAKAPTCTENGWNAYETCSRCSHSTYEEIHALGHDIVDHEAKAPTCTEIGWNAYETCKRCDHSTYEEQAALGHRVMDEGKMWVSPLQLENDKTYPFEQFVFLYSYKSSNKLHGSSSVFTITALYDCTLKIEYAVSSEASYDKLIINLNQTVLVTTSGLNTSFVATTIDLKAGDVVTISYKKDGSVSANADEAAFILSFDDVEIDAIIPVAAENKEPTCTEAVVCHFCQTVVKEALGHDEISHTAKAPTCTEIGWDEYVTCSRCDHTTYTETPATGHIASDWIVDLNATYEAEGSKHKECIGCRMLMETSIIPMLTHSYVAVVTPPTCTERGYTTHTCSDCGNSYVDDYVPAMGHDGMLHSAKAPTCTEIGWDAYETCSRCDHSNYTEIPAAGHIDSEWIVDSAVTCTLEGSKHIECTVCKQILKTEAIEKLGHSVVVNAAKAPTCTEIGWDDYETCTRCDYTTYAEILANGHSYGDWEVILDPTCTALGTECRDCNNCEHYETRDVAALGHDEVNHDEKAPTCTEIGWKAYATCSRCDYSTCVEIPATGHSMGEWVVTKAPTCTMIGTERRNCKNCDYFETRDVAALGHNEINHEAQAPTCTEIGWNAYVTCSRCGYTTYKEIEALGHDKVHHDAKAPTCTDIGWEAYVTCSRCGYTTYKEIEALGHDEVHHDAKTATCTDIGWEAYETCTRCGYTTYKEIEALGHDKVHHEAKAPTCTEIGWDAYDTCSRCNYTTYAEISATGHTASDWIIDEEATYEANGSKHKECTICHEVLETSKIPMLKHSYESVVTAPTCTEQGYTTYTCSSCGDSYVDDYVEAIGHHYSEWATVEAPTCTAGGQERRDCDNCEHYETRNVDAHGHDIVSHPAHPATCTEIGWHAYETCLRCDYTTYVEIPANRHSYGDWVETTAPTCTEDGEKAKECSVCHNVVTEVVDKLGHDEVTHNAQTATCEQIGWNAYVTCSRCDYTTYVEIPKLDHSMSEWTETTVPTCLEKGEERRDCSSCEYFETRELAALNHDRIEHEAKAPSCTDAGWDAYVSCSRCDYTTYVELPSKGGHTFGEWERIIDPTPDTAGMDRRTCYVCGHYENRDVAALGYLQAFIDAVETLSNNESAENTYSELYSALQLYSKLTDDEKQEANKEFLVLQAAINAYNSKAEMANTELKNATEIAFIPISASFTFLAALWFLLKKKFCIK